MVNEWIGLLFKKYSRSGGQQDDGYRAVTLGGRSVSIPPRVNYEVKGNQFWHIKGLMVTGSTSAVTEILV